MNSTGQPEKGFKLPESQSKIIREAWMNVKFPKPTEEDTPGWRIRWTQEIGKDEKNETGLVHLNSIQIEWSYDTSVMPAFFSDRKVTAEPA